jgi:lactoylglutathione lyase
MAEVPKLGWVIVYVPDVREAVAFYTRTFGLAAKFVHESGDFGELDTGSTALAFISETLAASSFEGGFRRGTIAEPPANIELALVFDDVAEGFRRAVEAGCTPLAEPVFKPHGQTVAYVRDPFGTLLELCSPIG